MKHKSKAHNEQHNTSQQAVGDGPGVNSRKECEQPQEELTGLKRLFQHWGWAETLQFVGVVILAIYTGLTYGLWISARETEQVDQRAWIALGKLDNARTVTVGGPESPEIMVPIKNYGKTPATAIVGVTVAEPVFRNSAPTFDYTKDPWFRVGLIQPNIEHNTRLNPVRSRSTGQPRAITPDIAGALQTGDVLLYVHGRITYKDVFGYEHWVTFCESLRPPELKDWDLCDTNNEIDGERR